MDRLVMYNHGIGTDTMDDSLASFFTDKISKLCLSLTSSFSTSSSLHSSSSPKTPPDFSTFKLASESEISKILFNCPNKECDSDPIPTWLLKECSALLVPTITINQIGLFSIAAKSCKCLFKIVQRHLGQNRKREKFNAKCMKT